MPSSSDSKDSINNNIKNPTITSNTAKGISNSWDKLKGFSATSYIAANW